MVKFSDSSIKTIQVNETLFAHFNLLLKSNNFLHLFSICLLIFIINGIQMKVIYFILVVFAMGTLIAPLLMFSFIDDKLVYAQQKEKQIDFIDIQQRMNLTLGKPIYTEIFTVPKSYNNNLSSSVYSFLGNGTLNGIKVSATGNGLMIPREDGSRSITDGRALFTSENGNATYSFESIIDIEDNITINRGAAFFDANATGNLEFLKSIVGVYKAVIGETGTFTMWQLK